MSKRFLSGINVTGTATLNTVANAGLDTDKFLVLDAAGNVDFRTGAEIRLDIGADVVSRVQHEVKLGETMTIGTPVYVPLAQDSGTNMTVLKASNASESTSSKTMGLIASSGVTNDLVQVITEGLLAGLNTGSATKGDPVWLGVNGALIFGLANKPVAPAHLVFLGIVTRAQTNNGEIFVKVQNGFEMGELHDYAEGSVQNNEVIVYESATSLYKPKSIPTILGYTPVPDSRTITINGTTYDLSENRAWTITTDASARSILRYVATAGQTTFTISGGYTPGLTDVYRNGIKLDNETDFTSTNGTTIVLTNGASVNDVIEVYRYQTAFLANNALRTVTEFIATAGQTTFNVTYNTGLVDVFYNGSKLVSTEYTAGNGTSIVLNFPCNVNDTLEVHAYSYQVGAFVGQSQLNGTGLVRMSGTTVSYDNATYATQSYVTTAVANLVNSAPTTLDTLNELAAALGNDANFATTIATSISTKQAQLNGTGFVKVSGTTVTYDNNSYILGSGNSTYLPIWDTGGVLLGNSRISQPDANNVLINYADTYSQGIKSTLLSVYKSQVRLGRTNAGADSNVDLIYDIEGTELFEIRRNYAAATFKVSLGNTAHLTISSTGAATFNSSIQAGTYFISNTNTDSISVGTSTAENAKYNYLGYSGYWGFRTTTSFNFALDTYNSGTPKNVLTITQAGDATFSNIINGTIVRLNSTQPIILTGGGNTGTYTQSSIYSSQNNTSGDTANGIFIERGRITDSGSGEVRYFVIGARGGSIQWMMNGTGYTTQYDTAEVKARADGLDLFVGRYSGGSAKLFRVYQSGADGYLELSTGASNIVTKLSGYGGTASYFLSNVGVGTANPGYKFDVDGGNITGAAFRATKQASQGDGLVAYFTNSSNGGYSSYIYIGSNPGTDWKVGKNISNPTNTTYHFEIVDSSNNVRMQINNTTGNVTFSGSVTQNSDIRLKTNIRSINNPLNKILQTRGVLYDRVDTIEKNDFGFIAQELEQVMPELIVTNDFGFKSIKYQNIVAVLVEAVKELKAEIDILKAR